jgi:uncharacterized membrane protein
MKNEDSLLVVLAVALAGAWYYLKSKTATGTTTTAAPLTPAVQSPGSATGIETTLIGDAGSAFSSWLTGTGNNSASTNSNSGVSTDSYS